MLRRAQSREDSFLEALTNVVLGFVLALVTQAAIYPLFGIATTIATDGSIAVIFTLVSLVRSYLVRRAFETFGQRLPRHPEAGGLSAAAAGPLRSHGEHHART